MRRGVRGVPIVINNRDLAAWPRAMVKELRRMKHCGPIVVVDNGSTSKAAETWYSELAADNDAVVIYARFNGGHKAPWTLNVPQALFTQFGHEHYIATDPDLDLSSCPDTTIEHMLDTLGNMQETPYNFHMPGYTHSSALNMKDKLGLGIKVDDVPAEALFFPQVEADYHKHCKPTRPNYKNGKGPLVMPAPVDTTFALYSFRRCWYYGIGGCRTSDILMRHLPYYYTAESIKGNTIEAEEFRYYLRNANQSSTAKKLALDNLL